MVPSDPALYRQVADPPVINQIRPTVVFQEPGRRLYVQKLSNLEGWSKTRTGRKTRIPNIRNTCSKIAGKLIFSQLVFWTVCIKTTTGTHPKSWPNLLKNPRSMELTFHQTPVAIVHSSSTVHQASRKRTQTCAKWYSANMPIQDFTHSVWRKKWH